MKTISKALILLVTSTTTYAQSSAKEVEKIWKQIAAKNPEVAISIGFIENGKENYFNYGNLSKDSKQPVNQKTTYEIGSVTKLITANIIVQAANEGKLKIDDFIENYLPKEYVISNNIRGKIKISDLASHQSGLPDFDFKKLMQQNAQQPLDLESEALHEILNDSTKLLDYGSYRYSNANFIILGKILEKTYGIEYKTILQEKILSPAKLLNTFTTDYNVENKVTGYDDEAAEKEFLNWNTLAAPAGLIKSNTADMLQLIKILLSNKGEIAKATQATETTFFKNTTKEIGLGQQMERSKKDVFFYKTGNTLGCSSIIAYDKKTNWGMIILINKNSSKLIAELINVAYDDVLGKKVK
jgi:CubicO group peptidase (beta-lactamase class C family)